MNSLGLEVLLNRNQLVDRRLSAAVSVCLNSLINVVGAASAANHSMQDSQFSCLVFMLIEKQRFRDANFSWGEMILIGQSFAVGSPGGSSPVDLIC